MNYGQGVTRAREKAGLSKRALALRCVVDRSYITHIESGRKVPTLSVLEAIAETCGVTMARLMELSEVVR